MFIEATFLNPNDNIAFDNYLLSIVGKRPILRVWEPSDFFVVMGRNSPNSDVNWEFCKADNIVVIRRYSAGGTVLLGPGCLNYTFVLPVDLTPQCKTIKGAFSFVLDKFRVCLGRVIDLEIKINGSSDLCLEDRKFSGNAQRRNRMGFYIHGSFLYEFPIDKITRYLAEPTIQPAYRRSRSHQEFLVNFPIKKRLLIEVLKETLKCLS